MDKSILIIDDEATQAESLRKELSQLLPGFRFEAYSGEHEIQQAIEHRFFSLAIVDLRMDRYTTDGLKIIQTILDMNPFARVIIVSAYTDEYFETLKDILLTGKIVDVLPKIKFREFADKLKQVIVHYFENVEKDPSEINNALLDFYAGAKNEKDTYRKGQRFEHFISLLFQSFGYREINKRVKDKSLNEIDLIVRNETDDSFLNKFGKYILIECKNYPDRKVDKNDFIVFNDKLRNSHGLAELGVLTTSGHITRNTYLEALRGSADHRKVIFMSNPEIETLIRAADKREAFKRLIDSQVKDN